MKWILNLLGVVLYFLMRYSNRTDKTVKFSGTFWFNDNWAETLAILGFDIVLMLLLTFGGITIDLEKYIPSLPVGIAFVGDLAICFFIGFLISHGLYELFASKKKT